ncbi:ABC transporter ATP-binding protein [Methanobacterium alcaliphilum]|uniref:ABC transporter ATP-binding protein n=1 Tax=Methanobacterium alcaliphilum TaxID=392018 RepID=UPI00200A6788|nr:ABC transporter ATP-binding protein [Methanobacterium alcaliphilum]MCK9151388.1 ABC transporter ATP-binding protein [Methanobacterium alcaliphilum]
MKTEYKEGVISTHNLTKNYGKIKAVDKISINVRKGEIYGFLGLNGAGKTTTIQMLLGMVHPSSGEAYLNGQKINANSHDLWNRVGHLVEIPYSYPELTVRENLEIICRLRSLSNPDSVNSVIEKLKLNQYQDREAKNLSLGNLQRLGLAKALIHNPDILILDEPSNALDPAGIVEIRELLLDLALNKGVTIFISSHMLSEISKIATRVGIIHEGKLIQEMTAKKLHQLRNRSLLIDVNDINRAISILTNVGLNATITDDGLIEIKENEVVMHPENVNSKLVNAGFSPRMLKVEEEELESYFLRIIDKRGVV